MLTQEREPETIGERPDAPTRRGRRDAPLISSATALNFWLPAAICLLSLVIMGAAGLVAWHWASETLLHIGAQSAGTTFVDRSELLQEVRAFQLITIRETYASQTTENLAEVFNAGSTTMPLPGWLAGEHLGVQGKVDVTAGVDLAQVQPEDIRSTRAGKDLHVQITVPAAKVMSTELVPNTLKMATSAGVLTGLGQTLGLSDQRLRDRAADDLAQSARGAAVRQGIQADATREAQHRLQAFLDALPQNGGHVDYTVVVRSPAVS